MRLMRAAACLLLLSAACAGPARSTPVQLRPSDVIEYAALPPGYERGGRLSERCSGERGLRAIHDQSLLSVDCSSQRLSRMLRARAAEQGSRALVGKSCRAQGRERVEVECSASLAHASSMVALGAGSAADSAPAPSPAQVLDLDEPRPQDVGAIRVSFEPSADARPLPERAYDRVAETSSASVGRRNLGQVSARCEDCADTALRHALRITAGRLGAGEVAAVRCFRDDDKRCVATALEPWTF